MGHRETLPPQASSLGFRRSRASEGQTGKRNKWDGSKNHCLCTEHTPVAPSSILTVLMFYYFTYCMASAVVPYSSIPPRGCECFCSVLILSAFLLPGWVGGSHPHRSQHGEPGTVASAGLT